MKKIADVAEKMGQVVTGGYRKLEDGVVSGYRKLESGAVTGFEKVTDKCVDVLFARSSSCRVDIFRPGEYSLEDKLTAAETFLGGGTNFERPIREAIHLMESEGFEMADVVFITDGECELSDACRQELQSAQATYHFTATGVLLDEGHAGMGFSLESFCQNVHQTNSLFGANVAPLIDTYR